MNSAKLAGELGIGVASNVESVRIISLDDKIRLIVVFSRAVSCRDLREHQASTIISNPKGAKFSRLNVCCHEGNHLKSYLNSPSQQVGYSADGSLVRYVHNVDTGHLAKHFAQEMGAVPYPAEA
jgi:hypothetical protein